MQYLNGLKEIVDCFDVFLLDQWGVLHNGMRPLPYACAAISALKRCNKKLIMISNSCRRSDVTKQIIRNMGFESIDYILTAGEYLNVCLTQNKGNIQALGKKIWLWGGEIHEAIIDSTSFVFVQDINLADFVLCTGLVDGLELEAYRTRLTYMLNKHIPLLCANPDRVSLDLYGKLILCPGSVADMYQKMGGEVYWIGKPYSGMYEHCLAWSGVEYHRVIGIGDSLYHDIQGAKNVNLQSCFITTGIHVHELNGGNDHAACESLFEKEGIQPNYVIDYFKF